MPSSWCREVALCQILYNGLDYQNKTFLETMSQGRFLKADKHEGWEIYEDLAEKTLQWELTPEESRIAIPVSSKRGLHSIETYIAYEAKFNSIAQN